MSETNVYQSELLKEMSEMPATAKKSNKLLRLIRASQPISRTEIATRLGIDKSTVTENVKPLLASGVLVEKSSDASGQGRRSRVLSFADNEYFIGVNLGVRTTQVGLTNMSGEIVEETDFETPLDAKKALSTARKEIEKLIAKQSGGKMPRVIGVSVPGLTDISRTQLVFAPNLGWQNIDIAKEFYFDDSIKTVVENDATAAAMYEARLKIGSSNDGLMSNFILVRSGTGIGVGMVIGSEVYRGSGSGRGIAGEFGHMTIVAGGKSCVCGNRGCWEKYASAASAASLYTGDRPLRPSETMPRFVEIVSKAENGEIRAQRTLEKIGDYLGIGIANVIMGIGITRVIISGRLVYGWSYIKEPLFEAINRSIIGKIEGWTIEKGEPVGAVIGGALEVAVEEYLAHGLV